MSAFHIGDMTVATGTRATIDLPVSTLSNHTRMSLPVHVVHGEAQGPVMFVSAAIHGDEILGVEIIRRVLAHPALGNLKRHVAGNPHRQQFRLSQSHPLHARPARPQPLVSRVPTAVRWPVLLADLFFREVVLRSQFRHRFPHGSTASYQPAASPAGAGRARIAADGGGLCAAGHPGVEAARKIPAAVCRRCGREGVAL